MNIHLKSSLRLGCAAVLLSVSGNLLAQACVVADEAGDFPVNDVATLAMFSDSSVIRAEVTMTDPPAANPGGQYTVYWTASGGQAYYLRAVANSVALSDFVYGTWEINPTTGGRTTSELGSATGSIEGNTYLIEAPLADVGNPSGVISVEAWGAYSASVAGVQGGPSISFDTTEPAPYVMGSSCSRGLDMVQSVRAKADSCEVVTDAALDMAPQFDIVSGSMFKQGNMIGATLEMTDMNAPSVDTVYAMHWVDSRGNGYFIGVGLLVDAVQGVLEDATADVGTYDPSTGIYTWDADASALGVASSDGNTVTVLVDERAVGLPAGELTGIGAMTTEYFSSFYPAPYDSTANDGVWSVGSACGKGTETDESVVLDAGARVREAATAAGSLGWLVLMLAGVAGLRRRG